MHGFREKAHGAVETIAAKPTQHLLGAMREKYDAQRQSQDRRCGIILCGNEFSKHCDSSPFSLTLCALPMRIAADLRAQPAGIGSTERRRQRRRLREYMPPDALTDQPGYCRGAMGIVGGCGA